MGPLPETDAFATPAHTSTITKSAMDIDFRMILASFFLCLLFNRPPLARLVTQGECRSRKDDFDDYFVAVSIDRCEKLRYRLRESAHRGRASMPRNPRERKLREIARRPEAVAPVEVGIAIANCKVDYGLYAVFAGGEMSGSIKVGSLFGIPIRVHFSWAIVFVLVTVAMIGHFAATFPELSATRQQAAGLFASALFFGSVLFHEMAHSLLAKRQGQSVRAITLFVFGGISELETEAERPGDEIRVALIGPVASYVLALAFGAVWYLSRGNASVISSLAGWLATINLGLGTFNLLPGLPLDGGRVLRGVVWRATGNPARATLTAANAGRIVGYLLILIAIWLAFAQHDHIGGLWLGLIGFFLINAAESSVVQMETQRAFSSVQAEQVMTDDCHYVPASASLAEFVERFLLQSGRRCFLVGDRTAARGIITLTDVRAVPRDRWSTTSVQAAMRPMEELFAVPPDTTLREVVRMLDSKRISQVLVMRDGQVLGMIGHDQLLRLIRNRMELAA
ncbi:MAG: site-2 protease family protein [Blastocatellia bacterium]|nr:site-2 protease family protein [Blastocatellia bacterium]